jgi:PIN domain nuclease of toxin-antitoxin system
MNLLLDTHTLLWYISGDKSLPSPIIAVLNNTSNRCFVSIASIWEIAIKLSLNKLEIKGGFGTIEDFLWQNDFEILPIGLDDVKAVLNLEFIHRDPFDRMLIAQALSGKLTLVSKDQQFKNYNVPVIW